MLGSAAFRTGIAPGGALAGPWVRNPLWTRARAVPSLDLRFADNKSLVDAKTGASLVTFTRASTGTYVGSDGVLRSAVTNLCLQSENFTTTWTNFLSTEAPNTAIAPNGTLTADTLIPDSGTTSGLIRQDFSGATFTDNTNLSFSVYVKAAGLTDFNIQFFNKANTFYGTQTVNASTGALSGSGTLASTVVISVGNGWYRVSMTGISSGTGATGPSMRIVVTSTGDGTSGIYLWGAQLEQSSTAGEYIPTTSTINSDPRFDHNPTTGESLGLLVEEARTNLLLQSQDFTTSWSQTNVTITPNTTTSPDGSTNAETLLINSVGATTGQTTQSFTAGSTITVSVFAKKNASNFMRFELGNLCNCWFNLDTGVTGTNSNGTATVLFNAKSIQPFGNGWYRCVLTVTTSVITTLSVSIFATNTDGNTSSIGSSIFLWGAEAEVGAFPTSYIPTTSATATRAADVASVTGTNFSSWYNQTEGSFFCSTFAPKGNVVYGTGDTFDNTQYATVSSINNVSIRSSSAVSAILTAPVSTTGLTNIAHGYAADNFAAVSNGGTITTDTSGAVPLAQVRLKLGSSAWDAAGTNILNGTIKRLTYWPVRLSNPTLQAITTP